MGFPIIEALKDQVYGLSNETDKALDRQDTGSLTVSTDAHSAIHGFCR